MSAECPVVECQGGKIKGFVGRADHPEAKDVFTYYGVPFADPPLGKLRFMPPQPYSGKWEGVRDATKPGKCPMNNHEHQKLLNEYMFIEGIQSERSEDCLYLNVYTPTKDKKANLPVMVFFYGGGFSLGDNISYDCTALSGMNDTIVVVPNYRLHVFGFLSFGADSCLPGNAGIWDQHMTLRWVRDNISNFGGNPDNVTIFGESAGSISVSCHLNSPLSRGLFHRAICHSGTVYATAMDPKQNDIAVEDLMRKLEITETDPDKRLEILQDMDRDRLQDAFMQLAMEMKGYFGLVVDKKHIPEAPRETVKKREVNNKVPCMIGYNNSEGTGIMGLLIPDFNTGLKEEVVTGALRQILEITRPDDDIAKLIESAKKFFIKDDDDPLRFSKFYGDIVMDTIFRVGSIETAKATLEMGTDTYMYHGAFQMKCCHDGSYSGGLKLKPDFVECDHADDLFLIFGVPFLSKGIKFTDDEKLLSQNFMKYLTNFAKYGDPNKGEKIPTTWPKYDEKHKLTLNIGCNKFDAFENDVGDVIQFWSKSF